MAVFFWTKNQMRQSKMTLLSCSHQASRRPIKSFTIIAVAQEIVLKWPSYEIRIIISETIWVWFNLIKFLLTFFNLSRHLLELKMLLLFSIKTAFHEAAVVAQR